MEKCVFYDNIKLINNTLRITIPSKTAQALGFKQGDVVKITLKKIDLQEE